MRLGTRLPVFALVVLSAHIAVSLFHPTAPRACDRRQKALDDSLRAVRCMSQGAQDSSISEGGALPEGDGSFTDAQGTHIWSQLVSIESNNYNADCNPWITADGRKLFFISFDNMNGPSRPGFQGEWDIYEAEWDSLNQEWGEGVNLGPPINTAGGERRPSATVTGDTLFFCRGPNVWVATRNGGAWNAPVLLFPGSDPCISVDARQMYFVRNGDIWVADRGASIYQWLNLRSIGPPVNSQYAEVRPFISFDRQKLYWSDFGNPRPGGYGASDVWVSMWSGTSWGPPVNVGPPINTDRNACTPYLSIDGRRFYTASESFEGSRGDEDVWISFLDSLPVPRQVAPVQGTWVKCGELPGSWNVYDLAEGTDGALYAATSPQGRVFRSEDAGATWTPLAELPGAQIAYSILVTSDGSLYAGTYPRGDVFRSTDRGVSWQATANIPGATTVRALLEAQDGRIMAGVSPTGAVFSTNDGGAIWSPLATLPGLFKNGVTCLFQTSNGAFFAGGWGPPYRSMDGGATWAPVNDFPFPPGEMRSIDSFYETSDSTIWATGWVHGHGGYVFKSTDNGAVWDTTGTIRIGPVHAVRVYAMDEDDYGNLRIGYQPGPDSVVSVSADNGVTWRPEGSLPGAHEVFAFLRTSGGSLFAATTPNGDVFKWTDGITGVSLDSDVRPTGYVLEAGSPNPFKNSISLSFSLGAPGHCVIAVYDVLGRRVRTLYNGYREKGIGMVSWDGLDDKNQEMAKGVYFVRMEFQGGTSAKKITLVH